MKNSEPVFEDQYPELELAVTPDSLNSPEELAMMVADALDAKRCVVSMTSDERIAAVCSGHYASFGEVHLSATTAIVEYSDARDKMFSVLELGGKAIGVVQVSGPRDKRQFNEHDLKLLRIFAAFIAKAVEADRLQKLVASPFARMTLKRASDQTIGDIVAQSVQNPGQLSKMLARSFYREMTRAGFDFNQIIGAATEIISELASNVRKHSDRKTRRGS
ncbi:GAF domain protein [Caballeronia pedi]|uniref:GAF domain protein n=1 Tax=Caballeronia pedi TaxID=1777141 RepID=A0A158CC22_9BURK|nr:GAF domain-containing protein [Caballeronia pedi]SAK79850.1 GAF domain protein [Caballeronia pedi]